jgi:hypothetical protein
MGIVRHQTELKPDIRDNDFVAGRPWSDRCITAQLVHVALAYPERS